MRRLERILCDNLKAQLNGKKPRAPDAGMALMQVFGQLAASRSWHSNGPNPISFADIEAYCRLMRLPLRPDHISIIQALDHIWTEDFYQKRNKGAAAAPMVSNTPLSAGLFDALTGG